MPTCPVEIRASGEIWVKPVFGYSDPVGHWRQRLGDGLAHNLNLVIAKAVHGQLAARQPPSLDFINKAFECLDLIGWEHAADVLPSVIGQMAAARGAEESTA